MTRWPRFLPLILAFLLAALPATVGGQQVPNSSFQFLEQFQVAPATPQPWTPPNWAITTHVLETAGENFGSQRVLPPLHAQHGPGCEPPLAIHTITAYPDAVFLCRDHMMTVVWGGYASISLMPPVLVDFSQGEAIVKFDLSTLKTSNRDWISVVIEPYGAQSQLNGDSRAVTNGIEVDNSLSPVTFWQAIDWRNDVRTLLPGVNWISVEDLLVESPSIRTEVEIRISQDHIRVANPSIPMVWTDQYFPDGPLSWNKGTVQFQHHAYNSFKGCDTRNRRSPLDDDPLTPENEFEPFDHLVHCGPNTWHWNDIAITPAQPFTIIPAFPRLVEDEFHPVTLLSPAPVGSHLRFVALGNNVELSANGGPWVPAQLIRPRVGGGELYGEYWTAIPAGTTSVRFRAIPSINAPTAFKDIAAMSLTVAGASPVPTSTPGAVPTNTPASTPVPATATATVTATVTATPTPIPPTATPAPPAATATASSQPTVVCETIEFRDGEPFLVPCV